MRKIFLGSMATLCFLAISAQKVDLDRYWFSTSSRSLPTNPLPPGSRTYRVDISNSSVVSTIYSDEALKSTLAIDGFRNTDPKAHLNIFISFSDLIFDKKGVNEKKVDLKDKDGKVTGQRTYYSAYGNYRFGVDVYIKDSNFSEMDHFRPMSTDDVQTYNSSDFETYNDAAKYFNTNVGEIKRNLAKTHTDNALNSLRGTLKARYGYPVTAYRDFLWILDSKKHDEYKQHQEMWDRFKAITVKFNGAENITDELRNELKPVTEYFMSLRTKYASEEKADKKFRHCSFFTVAKINLLLDKPEEALKEAELLVANGFDVKDAEILRREANTMIERFNKNAVTSTHFPIDITMNNPPK